MLLLQNTIITCSHCSPGEAQSAPSWSPTGTLSDRGNDLKMLILFCQERTIDHTQSNAVTTQTKFMWPYGRHLNLKVLPTQRKNTLLHLQQGYLHKLLILNLENTGFVCFVLYR